MGEIIKEASDKDKHKDDVQQLVFCKNHLYSGSYDGTVKKWSPDLELLLEWRAHDYAVNALVADADDADAANDHRRLFTSSLDGEIKEWDADDGQFRRMFVVLNPIDDTPTDVKTLALRNGLLYAGDNVGNVFRFQPNFVKDRHKLTYTEVWSLAVSLDGGTIFTARDNTVLVADMATDFHREMFKDTLGVKTSIPGRAPVVLDERHLACVDRNGMKVVVCTNDGKEYPQVALLEGHDMIVNALLLSRDHLVSSGWDGRVKLWRLQGGQTEEVSQVELKTYVNCLAWQDQEETGQKLVFAGGKGGRLVKLKMKI